MVDLAYDLYKDPRFQPLWDRLVPDEGKCETLEGELLRAIGRIYHDYLNNGFGNNWSGALNFLDTHLGVTKPVCELLSQYSRGRVVRGPSFDQNDPILVALDTLGRSVLTRITTNLSNLTPNPCDMFDLQDKDGWGDREYQGDEDED